MQIIVRCLQRIEHYCTLHIQPLFSDMETRSNIRKKICGHGPPLFKFKKLKFNIDFNSDTIHSCFAPTWNRPKYCVNHKSTEISAHRLLWMVTVFTRNLHPRVPQLLTNFPSHVHACKHAHKTLEGFEACLLASFTLWVKLSLAVARPDSNTCGTQWNVSAWLYML